MSLQFDGPCLTLVNEIWIFDILTTTPYSLHYFVASKPVAVHRQGATVTAEICLRTSVNVEPVSLHQVISLHYFTSPATQRKGCRMNTFLSHTVPQAIPFLWWQGLPVLPNTHTHTCTPHPYPCTFLDTHHQYLQTRMKKIRNVSKQPLKHCPVAGAMACSSQWLHGAISQDRESLFATDKDNFLSCSF